MKIGLLKEEKVPIDKRVVFSPKQCKKIISIYPNVSLVVQSCKFRCFSDIEYISEGIDIVIDLRDCDILLGVKEVSEDSLIPNKTYFFFSHTIKKQPYNRELLVKMINMNINMVDYEVLKSLNGSRLLGFGRYAGIIGAYNAFLAYGLKSGRFSLKPAHLCDSRVDLEKELQKLILNDEKIVITGSGRVGRGVMEIMKRSAIREVTVDEFLNKEFNEAIFVHLNTMDYNVRIDGSVSDKYDFYSFPDLFKSSFNKFSDVADIFIAGHYFSSGSPYLFTRDDAKLDDFKLRVIADISCDIDGPIASTIRSSSIARPIYGYNKYTEQEVSYMDCDAIAVMAVSNLPCELPMDSSEDFGNEMIKNILPLLINGDENNIINNATICKDGDLTPNFEYLRGYVNGFK